MPKSFSTRKNSPTRRGELVADGSHLRLTVGSREEERGPGVGRSHDDPAFRTSACGHGRRVFDELKAEHVDEESDRFVVVVDDEGDLLDMHCSPGNYDDRTDPGRGVWQWRRGRLSVRADRGGVRSHCGTAERPPVTLTRRRARALHGRCSSTPASRTGVDDLAWDDLGGQLDSRGFALTQPLLDDRETQELADLFDGGHFRSTIDMVRHRFGDGSYRYLDHPLPDAIADLRRAFYRRLAPVANHWSALLGGPTDAFPLEHDALLARCHAASQTRPTPLLLRYGRGDWNALHQDLYRGRLLPIPGADGARRPLRGRRVRADLEQRPRAQSRAHVLTPPRGAFVIFPTRERPNAGKRGYHGVGLRHGVSTVTAGSRTALGIIFHDAR